MLNHESWIMSVCNSSQVLMCPFLHPMQEICGVEIEDESQLDDSPANF